MTKKKIIIITGPTATGKTQLSLDLALKFKLPIVNADSLLFYKELNIGVAKPTVTELNSTPHYLINIVSISQSLNAKSYRDLALQTFEKIWQENKSDGIILAGGAGFYIKALLYGMYDSETVTPDIQERSNSLYQTEGIKPFLEILRNFDQPSYKKLHANDHYRIRRAVEHWWLSNTAFSEVGNQQAKKNLENPFWKEQGWELLTLYTDIPKDIHQEIISQRTKQMLDSGLIEEVKELLQNFTGREKPLQSIGYKEVQDFLSGKILNLKDLHQAIVISTRQLAKSQRTWFTSMNKIELTYPHFQLQAEKLCTQFLI